MKSNVCLPLQQHTFLTEEPEIAPGASIKPLKPMKQQEPTPVRILHNATLV
jgi:hypothetical protein